MGVWIETVFIGGDDKTLSVTPFVGVWIETSWVTGYDQYFLSHPSWVCGLKPFICCKGTNFICHTLRGCVD
ncbi:Uncharacterised protein [Segatella copri]|nr:Uncharacterised protein [Segatella copri]